MNEIELATMAYILEEKMKWVQNQETDEIWYHIYYICLKSKELTSNDDIFNPKNVMIRTYPLFKLIKCIKL